LILLWIFMVIHPKLQLRMWLWRPRKESPMEHAPLTMIADKFQWVFSESWLNACAKDVRLGTRPRILTPFRWGLALTTPCASPHVETIAAFPCAFQAFWGPTLTSKACYNQVAKPHFAEFARTMAERLIRAMTLKVLGCETGRAVGEFRPIVLQDGSSCARHARWREVLPGCFTAVKPAAVALHPPLDLLGAAPPTVVLPPATANEPACLPAPAFLRDSGLWAERGSSAGRYLRRVQDEHGFLLIRAPAGRQPQGVEALREDGKGRRSRRPKPLKAIHAQRPKRQRVELGVRWEGDGRPLGLRLRSSWHPRPKRFCYFLTTLPAKRYPLEGLCRADKWRWPVERLLKEWPAYAKLHAFDTAKGAIVEGLLWTAIAAAALKRWLAHMPPLLLEGPMSTRKVAMCARPVFGDLGRALQSGDVAGL
jgi:hypothetical protein